MNKLHKEKGYISKKNAHKIYEAMKKKKNIVAVGTTVLRLLEDCYSKFSKIKYYNQETDLFVYPGFEFNVVDSLITNFHLPKTTLLLLVSAFAGEATIRDAYQHAIDKSYRFYSYGDAMLLNRKSDN